MIVIERIVGTSNKKNWTQVYSFFPEGEKKSLGDLILVLRLSCEKEEKDKEFDLAAFGKEAITRFNETYYGSASPSAKQNIIDNLKESFAVLAKEFGKNFKIEGIAAVVLESEKGRVLYLAKQGGSQAKIWRADRLFSLLSHFSPTVQVVSGFLQEEDLVILGTKDFFEVVPEGTIKAACQSPKTAEAVEMIVPLVHGREDNSGIAAAWFKLKVKSPATSAGRRQSKVKSQETEKQEKRRGLFYFKGLLLGFREKLGSFSFKRKKRGLGVSLKPQKSFKPVKKTTLSIAFIFLLLLVLSVFFGSKKKKETERFVTESAILEKVVYNLEEAQGLTELNPLRAKSLLKEAGEFLKEYRAENKEVSEEFKVYEDKVSRLLAEVSKEHKIESPDIFFDFSLAKEGFSGEKLGLSDKELAVLSKEKDAVLNFNLEDKSAQIIVGGEEAEDTINIGAVGPWVFLAKKDKLLVIDKIKKEKIDEKDLDDIDLVSLLGFGGNAYILDKEGGQIWRFAGLEDGLAGPKEYLKGEDFDFSQATSMAIDGSVWILFSNGEIVKYTRGLKDGFAIAGLDMPFSEEIKLFTNEDQDNLYVLDRINTRVVVIGKSGEYRGSYIWPGIAGVSDFVVSEELGKILLLTGDRIYGLEIRS